jgi:hypothetical protein
LKILIETIKENFFFIFISTVSHSFGYGLMDAAAMVRLARGWATVAPQQFCEVRAPDTNK